MEPTAGEVTRLRALVAVANYLAACRPDIEFVGEGYLSRDVRAREGKHGVGEAVGEVPRRVPKVGLQLQSGGDEELHARSGGGRRRGAPRLRRWGTPAPADRQARGYAGSSGAAIKQWSATQSSEYYYETMAQKSYHGVMSIDELKVMLQGV